MCIRDRESLAPGYINGLSLLGGEPFEPENQRELLPFIKNVKVLYPNKKMCIRDSTMPDQYTRTRAQLGTPALDVLRRAHVAVFGIGGVGGQAVEVLARSGVGS